MNNVHLEIKVLKKVDYINNSELRENSAIKKLAYNHAANYAGNNYTKKIEDDFIESYLLTDKKLAYKNSEELFLAVDELDKNRTQSQLAYNLIISLDHKISYEANLRILNELLTETFLKNNLVCDVSIHNKDNANLHSHILVPMREIDEGKLCKKFRGGFNNKDFNSYFLRKKLAEKFNEERKKIGISEQIDYRSNEQKMELLLQQNKVEEALAFNYKAVDKKYSKNKAFRKQRIEAAKQRKEKAAAEAKEYKKQREELAEKIQEVRQIRRKQRKIIQAAESLQEKYDETSRILNNSLNQQEFLYQTTTKKF